MGLTTPSPLPSTSLDDAYRFKLVDGKVTQLEEFDDGRWKSERIRSNETWKFDGTSLTHTETDRGRVKTTIYRDADGDGVFTRADRDSLTGLSSGAVGSGSTPKPSAIHEDSYRFLLVDGKVTQLEEFEKGRWHRETIKSNESWTFDGSRLIEREVKRLGTTVTSYGDADKDGIFTKIGTSFEPIVANASSQPL
jgi:hypothetical protein